MIQRGTGCGQSHLPSAQDGTAKCVTMPIAANVCLVSVGQLTDMEKMLQDPAEVTAALRNPQPKPNLN